MYLTNSGGGWREEIDLNFINCIYTQKVVLYEYIKTSEALIMENTKKRVQVQLDKDLSEETESVLSALGLTPTTAITMFYKRIVAKNGLPFDAELTQREQDTLKLIELSKNLPIKELDTKGKLKEWLDDPNEWGPDDEY